jgi:hypothetical protein
VHWFVRARRGDRQVHCAVFGGGTRCRRHEPRTARRVARHASACSCALILVPARVCAQALGLGLKPQSANFANNERLRWCVTQRRCVEIQVQSVRARGDTQMMTARPAAAAQVSLSAARVAAARKKGAAKAGEAGRAGWLPPAASTPRGPRAQRHARRALHCTAPPPQASP